MAAMRGAQWAPCPLMQSLSRASMRPEISSSSRCLATNFIRRQQGSTALPAKADKEAYYRYYFGHIVSPPPLRAQSWIPRTKLSAQEAVKGLAAVDDVTSDLQTVAHALKNFVATHQLRDNQDSSRPQVRSVFRDKTPGQRALLWLLKAQGMRSFAFMDHPYFLEAVTHCLVAEDKLGYLHDWMAATGGPLSELALKETQHELWRGQVLLHTVEAQAYWSENPLLLDDGMIMFLSAVGIARERDIYLPLSMTFDWFLRALCRPGAHLLSVALFDRYIAMLKKWYHNKDEADFKVARLMLAHPAGPDASYLLAILEKWQAAGHDNFQWSPALSSNRGMSALATNTDYMAFWIYIETAQTLSKQGSEAKARWVLDVAKDRLPHMFAMKKPARMSWRQQYSSDRSSPRRPTAHEIGRGLADETGTSFKSWEASELARRRYVKPQFVHDRAGRDAFQNMVNRKKK